MSFRRNGLFFLVLFLLGRASLLTAEEVLDRVVAVVGNQIILQSELNFQLQLYLSTLGQNPTDPLKLKQAKLNLLEQMISDRLISVQADKDTTLRVSPPEIEAALEQHIERIKSQFGSEEEFIKQLAGEGLTLNDLRVRYKQEIRGQLLKEKLISQRLSRVNVSSKEVRDFYETFKDSLPIQPAGVKLAHIMIQPQSGEKTLDSLQNLAEEVLKKARSGADFAQLAHQHSQDPTSKQGGDLGFFSAGELDSTFEKVAFSLAPGELSGVVKTNYGYHLIKVEERKGNQVRARHILFLTAPSAFDEARAENLIDSLYQALAGGADFAELARTFSDDVGSQKMGGELGWVNMSVLEPVFQNAIAGLDSNQISKPFRSSYGFHIFKLIDRRVEKRLTLEEDGDTIKDLARRYKTGKEIEKWVKDLKKRIYVEVRETN